MTSDEELLKTQIRQLKEVVVAAQTRKHGLVGMEPSELQMLIETQSDGPLHPRLSQMLSGHVNYESLKRGLKRLENDLYDLDKQTVRHSPKYEFNTDAENE